MKVNEFRKYPQTCLRCNLTWMSSKEHPNACPVCKSYEWDKPRKIIRVTDIDKYMNR